jgi:hypothetical protein
MGFFYQFLIDQDASSYLDFRPEEILKEMVMNMTYGKKMKLKKHNLLALFYLVIKLILAMLQVNSRHLKLNINNFFYHQTFFSFHLESSKYKN